MKFLYIHADTLPTMLTGIMVITVSMVRYVFSYIRYKYAFPVPVSTVEHAHMHAQHAHIIFTFFQKVLLDFQCICQKCNVVQ